MVALRAALGHVAGPPALDAPLVMRARRPLALPLTMRLHARLGRMMQVFATLFAHVLAHGGDAPPRRKPAPRPDAPPAAPRTTPQDPAPAAPDAAARSESPPRAPRGPHLPGRAGWLVGLSAEIAAYAGQLAHLIADPESLAVLRASPALVRLLHPLCRMLGVAMPAALVALLPPKPPRPPRAPRPRRRRWHPPRRADLHFLLRMGKPIPEN